MNPAAARTATTWPRPIDPFAAAPDGCYQDDAVTVIRRPGLMIRPGERWTARTPHFRIGTDAGRLAVLHALPPAEVTNDAVALIAGELVDPGWVAGAGLFERILAGLVLSSDPDPVAAWSAFYAGSLQRLDGLIRGDIRDDAGHGSLAEFAPIYDRAESLIAQVDSVSTLDLGCCFGFFPLRLALADPRRAVSAADVSAGTCTLLRTVAAAMDAPLPVVHCDAAAVPLPDGAADTVTLLHVLEHVDAEHGRRILTECLRLAKHQVIVAVPLETEATAAYGHVRTIDLAELAEVGSELRSGTDWHVDVFEHHGGWLVLRRP